MPFSEGSAVLPPPEAKAEGSQTPEKSGEDLRKKWLEEEKNDLSLPPFLIGNKQPDSGVKTSSSPSKSVEDLAPPPFMPSNSEERTTPPPADLSDLAIPPFLRYQGEEQEPSSTPPVEPIISPEPEQKEEEVIKIKPEDIMPAGDSEAKVKNDSGETDIDPDSWIARLRNKWFGEDSEDLDEKAKNDVWHQKLLEKWDVDGEKVTGQSEAEPKGNSLAGSVVNALNSSREALVGWMGSVGRKLPRFRRERPDTSTPDQPSDPTEGEAVAAKIESDPAVDPETKKKAVEVNEALDTLEGAINKRLVDRQNSMINRVGQWLGGSEKIRAGMAVALAAGSIATNGLVLYGAVESLSHIASGSKLIEQGITQGGAQAGKLLRGGFGILNYGNLSSRFLMGKVLAKEVPEAFRQTEEAVERLKDPNLPPVEKDILVKRLEEGIARQLLYYRQGIDIQRYYNQAGSPETKPSKSLMSRFVEWRKTDEGRKALTTLAVCSTPILLGALVPAVGAVSAAAGASLAVAAKAGMVGTSVHSLMVNVKRFREMPKQPVVERDQSPMLQETLNALQTYEQNRLESYTGQAKIELVEQLTKEIDKRTNSEASRYQQQATKRFLLGAIPAAAFYMFANAKPAQAAEHGSPHEVHATESSATGGIRAITTDEHGVKISSLDSASHEPKIHSLDSPKAGTPEIHSYDGHRSGAPKIESMDDGHETKSPPPIEHDKTFHTPESEVPGGTTNTESTPEGAVPNHEFRDPDYRPNFTDKLSGEGATKPFGEVYGPEGDKHAVIDMNGDGVAQTAEEVKIIEKDGHYSALVQWADIYGKDGRPDYMHDHAVRIDMAPGDKDISISGKFGRLVSLDDPDRYISGFDKNGHPIEGSSTTAEIFQFSRKADVVEFHVSADTWSKVQEREDLKRDDWNLIVGRSGAIACNEEGAAEFQIDWQHVDDRLVGMANDTTFEYVPTVEPQNHDAILAATGGNEELTTVIEKKSFVFDNLGFRLEAIVIPASDGDSRVAITHAIEALRDTSFGMGDQIKAIWSDPSEKHKLIETLASNVHDGRISADQIREALLIPPKMSSITMGGAGWPWHEYGKRMQDWAKETMDHYKTTPWTISLKAIANITETRDKEIKTFSIGYNGLGQKIAEIELENHQKLQYIVPKESFPLGELEPKLK